MIENTGIWILFTLIIIGYSYFLWFLVGQDKISDERSLGQIPDGIDPATAHFLMNKLADSRTAAIVIVSLALDGYVDINDDDGEFLIYKRKEFADKDKVIEQFVFNTLFYDREFAVLGTKDSHKCMSLKYGLNRVFKESGIEARFIKSNKWAHLSIVFLGLIFLGFSAYLNDVVSIAIMFLVSAIAFLWFSKPISSYTEEGRTVVSTLEDMKYNGKAPQEIPWSMAFETEYDFDGVYNAGSFDWFGVLENEKVEYLTAMQRKENRKQQAGSFVSWLSENIVDTLNSVSANSRQVFEKGRRKGFRNPAAQKREKKSS